MALIRNEFRTGVLVLITAMVLAVVLIYLEAPGLTGQRRIFRVYFDNASGINVGAPVMLAGRKVGQVVQIFSPVPDAERPKPNLVVVIEVAVDANARIYTEERVMMVQYSLLGEQVIDFVQGNEASGVAMNGAKYIGQRQPGLSEVGQQVLEKIDPVIGSAMIAMQDLQKTSARLVEMTKEGSDLSMGISNFKQLGDQLLVLSGSDGSLQQTLDSLQLLTGTDSSLAHTFSNTEQFTGNLRNNKDIGPTLSNFRQTSESLRNTANRLNRTVKCIQPDVAQTVQNAEQFTDTVKREPWRLIWPSKKKYPEDTQKPCASPTPCVTPTPCATPKNYGSPKSTPAKRLWFIKMPQ